MNKLYPGLSKGDKMNNIRFRILLAEKDPVTAVDTVNFLTELGYNITSVVDSAVDAITKTETDRPDLILMDIHLRGSLNGVEAARILSFKYNIPIIFIATLELQQIFFHDSTFKYKECITRPVKKKNLHDTLEKALMLNNINSRIMRNKSYPPSGAVI